MDGLGAFVAVMVAVLDVIAIVHVWRSRIETGRKVVWSVVIVVAPVIGLICWALAALRIGKVRL
ncbi:PLDc N-terminal domain-containing protein [Stutzerimonas azotifigens]|uniref:PLDc N-terminal domain-containing protein n=1 Tax=Stutzerimonas azotifigens TaxID=291995 RepID=UPI0003F8DCDF|nr:PLDc N-terminal domain-containing protein [Stutzerimonas azotifigens]